MTDTSIAESALNALVLKRFNAKIPLNPIACKRAIRNSAYAYRVRSWSYSTPNRTETSFGSFLEVAKIIESSKNGDLKNCYVIVLGAFEFTKSGVVFLGGDDESEATETLVRIGSNFSTSMSPIDYAGAYWVTPMMALNAFQHSESARRSDLKASLKVSEQNLKYQEKALEKLVKNFSKEGV